MLLYSAWRSIPLNTRVQIANNFGIAKIGPTHVRDNYVESDGYRIEDVEKAMTVENIQKFLGTGETDITRLFEVLVARIEGREPKVEEPVVPEVVFPPLPEGVIIDKAILNPAPKKRGRPSKIK